MSPAESPVPITMLLTHREWVRRLARSMVRDEATVDDVEQRTWLAALRRPPRQEGAVRAWLARVVRSQALNSLRSSGRRAVHEQAAARDESVRSAAAIVAEAETHRRLVSAVLALDEPYRSTVLLRFFEDQPPRAVAERMGVPVETVRTRLRRAVETLRERLADGGGRDAWIAALAPIAGLRLDAGAAAGTPVTASAAVTGGTLMAGKATVLAAAAVLALAAGYAGGRLAGPAATGTPPADVAQLEARIAALESAARPDAARRAAPGPAPGSASGADRRLTSLDERQAEQDRRIETLEARVAALTATAGEAPRGAAATAPPAIDVEAEARRLQALPTAQLLAELRLLANVAGQLSAKKPEGEAVLRVCAVLVTRQLEAPERAEMLICRAFGHRAAVEPAGEEASLREAIDVAGASSEQGRIAAAQLGWVASRNGDQRAAAEWFLGVARQPTATPRERSTYRLMGANRLAATGNAADRARAREEYRALIDEMRDATDEDSVRNVGLAKTELERLDRGPGR